MHDAPRGGNGWRWAALLFGAAFLISGVLLLRDVVQSRRELDANQQLARRVREARDAVLTVPVLPARSGRSQSRRRNMPPPAICRFTTDSGRKTMTWRGGCPLRAWGLNCP